MNVDCAPCIVTDSTADIPGEIARRLDIAVIPCQIHLRGNTYLDGVDISRQELYHHMRSGELFTTSQPPVGVFAEFYRRALEQGRRVVAIHLGSMYSGLHDTACLAARETDPERITVVDSQQVSMCTGWLAIRAAEMAQHGRHSTEVLAQVRQMIPRLRLFALIDDLRFLYHGGRVGWIPSLLGQLLAIKPIVGVCQGRVELVAKARSFSRGLDRLATLAAELGGVERLAILHADASASVAQLAGRMAGLVSREHLVATEAGAVVSAHAGPGAAGFACVLRA